MKRHLMGIVGALSLLGTSVPAMAHETERFNFRDERPVQVDTRFDRDGGWRGRGEDELRNREGRELEMRRTRENRFEGRQVQEHDGRGAGWRGRGYQVAPAYAARRWR